MSDKKEWATYEDHRKDEIMNLILDHERWVVFSKRKRNLRVPTPWEYCCCIHRIAKRFSWYGYDKATEIIEDFINKGYLEIVPNPDDGGFYYTYIRRTDKPLKKSTKHGFYGRYIY